ncbi:class I SAM-dependent methyltransferase [Streptomyces sp. NPDC050504]|uniref:class I SAM-dependent methyltransferase n=1 Tax=Streptomyces sp. NPDC050504 TaxID=3365618 RepID=UPI0037A9BECA
MTSTAFDESERRKWAGKAAAYASGFARLCAHPIPLLLDAAGVREGTRLLDVGTGTGTVALAAHARGAEVTAVDAEPSMVALTAKSVPATAVHLAALPDLPFESGRFDAVTANFVLNHVGDPRAALSELRRVTRPGGRLALTIWAAPAAAGQTLLPRAVRAAGATPPPDLPSLPPEAEFPRTEKGLTTLLRSTNLPDATCTTLHWDHETTLDEWWSGPAAGVATIGQTITSQPPEIRAKIKSHYKSLSTPHLTPPQTLHLPHKALLAQATNP